MASAPTRNENEAVMNRALHAVTAAVLLAGASSAPAFAAEKDPYWPTGQDGVAVTAEPEAPTGSVGNSTAKRKAPTGSAGSSAEPGQSDGTSVELVAALGVAAAVALAGTSVVVSRRLRAPQA
jgi:hypothetical protein